MSRYGAWPQPARTMATDLDAAIRAAIDRDAASFEQARAGLDRQDPEQLRLLLGAMTRDLVEREYPDGLDSDDAEQILMSCTRAAAWYPQTDHDAFVVALTGALGVSEPAGSATSNESVIRAHGLLLIASLLGAQSERLPRILEAALTELRRAQTIELP